MDYVKIQALKDGRMSMRSAAAGALLIGVMHLGTGIYADRRVSENPPAINKISPFEYAVTSDPHSYTLMLESAGAFGISIGLGAAYASRRITRSLKE